MCERHESNYIQSEGYKKQNSHDSYSLQSHHDLNNSEKSLTELNNDMRNDLEDFKKRIRSLINVHWKLYDRDDGKTTGVLPNKRSKPINQEPQPKTDFKKLMTKFSDDQRVTNMFFKNNVIDMILKMKQNENNFQTKIKNMERKIDEWSKFQNISLEQTERTEPPPPPTAQTEHVNVVFTKSGKSDDSSKIQKDPPPPIIINNTIEKDKPIRTSKKGYYVVKTKEYPFRECDLLSSENVDNKEVQICSHKVEKECAHIIHMHGVPFRTISFKIQPSTYEPREVSILRIMLYLSVEELSLLTKEERIRITQG
ncbi:hypothetical protein Tco_1571437 [Tanacetum coccineum]